MVGDFFFVATQNLAAIGSLANIQESGRIYISEINCFNNSDGGIAMIRLAEIRDFVVLSDSRFTDNSVSQTAGAVYISATGSEADTLSVHSWTDSKHHLEETGTTILKI